MNCNMRDVITLDHQQVLDLLPERDPWGHKGTFGKVLLLCGSRGYTGAAYLSAMGALRSGAGLVYLGVPESIYQIEAIKLNEPVVFPLPDSNGTYAESASEKVLALLPDMDAVLVGCGIGKSSGSLAVLETVLKNADCPVVVDADGINLLALHKDLVRERAAVTILTPHDGEFSRFGQPVGENRMDSAAGLADSLGCIVLLKGHRTCITDGNSFFVNMTGNPGMAVGGSGDLLAGMITSLLGHGLQPLYAAACGAWLHGAAGDLCAAEIGQYGLLPSDMATSLPRLMK